MLNGFSSTKLAPASYICFTDVLGSVSANPITRWLLLLLRSDSRIPRAEASAQSTTTASNFLRVIDCWASAASFTTETSMPAAAKAVVKMEVE